MCNKKILFLISVLLINTHILLSQPFNGNYIIGGFNPDFNTVQEAVDSLMSVGISGPVTFNIRNGIYMTNSGSERVLHIPDNIPGASAANIITFQADTDNGAYADSVILKRTNGTNEIGWVAFIRSSFITLRNLTFEYAYADTSDSGVDNYRLNVKFQPAQGSILDSINIIGCRFVSSGNYLPFTALEFSGNGRNITIENSLFRRAGNGLYIERCNGCSPFNDIIVRNNTFRRLRTYNDVQNSPRGTAIYVSNGSNYIITGNNLDYESATGLFGITVIGTDVNISGNRIHNVSFQQFSFDSYWGLHLRSTGGDWLVSNNMISNIRKHAVGIHLENSSNIKVYNNTVVLTFVRFERQRALELQNVSDIDIKNNIFVVNANNYSNGQIIRGIGTNSNITADFNLLYSEPFHIYFDNTNYDSLTAWQSAGLGTNSLTFLPEFVSTEPYSDVHLGYCSLGNQNLFGIPFLEVPYDFDGETRDPNNPYLGADEVDSFRPDIFSTPNFYNLNNPGLFFSSADLDGDNDIDIAVSDNYSGNQNNFTKIFWNDGNGFFPTYDSLRFGSQTAIIRAADLDGDSFNDLVATDNDSLLVRWGLSGGTFSSISALPFSTTYGRVEDFVYADLDDDGDLDIAQIHFGIVGVDSGWVTQIMNEGGRNFSFSSSSAYRAGMHPSNISATYLDNDSLPDIVVNDYITNKFSSFINVGGGTDASWNGFLKLNELDVDFGTSSNHKNFGTADIDGDGDNDALIGSWVNGTDSLVFLINDGNGVFNRSEIYLAERRLNRTFDLFDYDNDGDPDIISATSQNDIVLYLNDGFGNFEIQRLCQISELNNIPLTILTNDFNADQSADMAVLTNNDFVTMLNLNWSPTGTDLGKGDFKNPQTLELKQNYPNPFNPATNIEFVLSKNANVKIQIYNVLGEHLKTILNEYKAVGKYTIRFDASDFSSGIYYYQIETSGIKKSRKMVLIK